ncbi:heterogeneous nuclear ribonucleoprotein Q-like isoform X2 [Apostichopus japonicus]|uniref:heterogeneous nuclear ribonucleoprotein Q-like isoform X2 n=1 Tax=Stichopus japonicus TaxID=307972 RepID=UPI003AB6548F
MASNGSEQVEEQQEVENVAEEAEGETTEPEESTETEAEAAEAETYERTEKYDLFLGRGFSDKISQELDKTYQKKLTGDEEFDDRALDAIGGLDDDTILQVLKHFCESDLSFVQNKSAYICGAIKMFRTKGKGALTKPEQQKVHTPDEDKIKELLERTGYTLNITRSQRQYGGPPPDWEEGTSAPSQGTEVFVKNIPKDWFEDKLVPLFEPCGKIYDIRLILDPTTGLNKGFAFVCFCEKTEAQEAIKTLDGHKANDRFSLSVSISYKMNRIFVGSIPKTKQKEQIMEEFGKATDGLKDVIVYTSSDDKSLNRGFAFLEYEDHKAAFTARKKLMSGRVQVFGGVNISVDWADPIIEPDEETMSKVKVVYIRNLTPAATEEKIKEKFSEFGELEKVKKIKDYCFVHYKERESAEKAIEGMDEKEFEGGVIPVCLAKPQGMNKKKERQARMQQSGGGYWDNSGGYGRQRGGGGMQRGNRGGGGGGMGYQQGGYQPDFGGYDDYYFGYDSGYQDYGGDWSYGGYGYGGRGGRGGPRGGYYYYYPKHNRISGRKTAKV